MSNLKAIITLNPHGTCVIDIERHQPNSIPQPICREYTWTLKGARRKARKMLAAAELADEYAKFREVIE